MFGCEYWLTETKPDSFRDRVWFCETFALQLDRTNHNMSWGRCWASNAGGLMPSLFFFFLFFCCTLVFQLFQNFQRASADVNIIVCFWTLKVFVRFVCPSFILWRCRGCLNHWIYIKLPLSVGVWRDEVGRSSDLLNLDRIAVANYILSLKVK